MKFIDMIGQQCGQLTVTGPASRDGKPRIKWRCVCSCGNGTTVDGAKLRSGHTKSCGSCEARRQPAIDRFLEKIKSVESGCIVWTGGLNGVGYGQFYRGKESADDTGKTYAHRWAYEYYVGPIPEGLHLDHLCRNRACVNVAHLEPVTIRENLLRGEGISAQHAKKTHCPAGHPYSGSNLYINPTKGCRVCRECSRRRSAERYHRTAQARKAS